LRSFVLALAVLAAAGCNKKEAPPAAPAPTAATVAAPAADGDVTGTVAETMDAANYTYLRLTTASGDVWAAIPTSKVTVGQSVTLKNPMRMENFESKTLGRTFDVILFAGALGGDEAQAQAALPPGHPTAPQADPGDVKVERAPGGKTIAEIFAGKAALKDQQVTLRGKVVKFTGKVLGKNWLHLRDGTGAEGVDNDLTVTSTDVAAVGDVVTVSGVVHLDRDIGAGYAYPVLIEDAKVAH